MAGTKDITKTIYGYFVKNLHSLFIYPPGKIYRGEYQTYHRIAIIEFLDSWKDKINGDVLDIGVGTWTYPREIFSSRCNYTAVDCYSHPNIDIVGDIENLLDMFSTNSYDFIIITDVLEHVRKPWKALRDINALLRENGVLLMTSPFNYPLHGNKSVVDYWRFSQEGIHQLLVEQGKFQQVKINPIGHPKFPYSYTVVAHK